VIRLQFVKGRAFSSRVISWFGAGRFSHVDAVNKDGSLWGARADHIGHVPAGFQIRPAGYEAWPLRVVYSLESTPAQERRFWDFQLAQLGKPYDHTAIWGFAFGRDWREEDSWFCSEVQAAASEYCGVMPELATPENTVMPGTLATVYSALGATIS